MEWTDEGIVLGVRRHGESSAIVELLTRSHGRHLGLVRGGAGSRMRPLLQPGNTVSAVWRARLDEHLGYYQIDGIRLRAATMLASSYAVYGVTHLASLARLLPERDPHEDIYQILERILDDFDEAGEAAIHVVQFELAMLAELGFGLDLATCAATGVTTDLVYVSPKSGNAVSRHAGEPWQDKLLRLPPFLRAEAFSSEACPRAFDPGVDTGSREENASKQKAIALSSEKGTGFEENASNPGWLETDLLDGFQLTGLFLLRHVLEPRGQTHSDAREGFIAAVTRSKRR